MKLLSIIVPNYNNAKYLPRCLDSILVSDSGKFEVIVVDDGSTDNSLEVLSDYNDSRLKILSQKNQGVSVARNYGVEQSEGKSILFCDSDDMYEKNAIDLILNYVACADLSRVITVFNVFRATGINLEIETKIKENMVADYSKAPNPLTVYIENLYISKPLVNASWWILYDANTIKANGITFPEGITRGQDKIFNIRYINCCEKLNCLDEDIYIYFYKSSVYASGIKTRTAQDLSQLGKKRKLAFEGIEEMPFPVCKQRLKSLYMDSEQNVLFRLLRTMCKQKKYSRKEMKHMIKENNLEDLIYLPMKFSFGFKYCMKKFLLRLFYSDYY